MVIYKMIVMLPSLFIPTLFFKKTIAEILILFC